MDDDGDWITARYLLASILGRDPMVVDYVDEESFPVDPPPARLAEAPAPAPAPAVSAPPAVRAPAGVAGTVCAVCTEEIAAADAVVRLPCAHWYHDRCIAPWLGIRGTCPTCRAEVPRRDAAAGDEEEEARRAKPPARARAGTSGNVAGASARARRDAAYEHLAGGVLSG
ncbi:E3 ubiquitin-protein ligase RNF181-like [Panicum virgatum]|uniref:RING-type domain-containing protein n=1 Tax=Panicum virgatum TaxID=38727 RepID=A0A8T0W234_PANVG|nr:E3 ubiquitin-protein ligase RNF181-like [Panicum virgatum]KAG2641415.1 hypothetical protein PVAP13_2KG251800 [Panicum virgatum]